MKKYLVRVTRDPDGETIDFDIEAKDWPEAKKAAVREAKRQPELFAPPPVPSYYVSPEDDDGDAAEQID